MTPFLRYLVTIRPILEYGRVICRIRLRLNRIGLHHWLLESTFSFEVFKSWLIHVTVLVVGNYRFNFSILFFHLLNEIALLYDSLVHEIKFLVEQFRNLPWGLLWALVHWLNQNVINHIIAAWFWWHHMAMGLGASKPRGFSIFYSLSFRLDIYR